MPPFRYLLFNKPFNVLSQFTQGTPESSESPRATLADFIPVRDVYPVGRLDYDSEGLMLLTNDGALQHQLTDPRYEHRRTYWAQVEGTATPEAARKLSDGVLIQGKRTRSCDARVVAEPFLPPREPPIRIRQSIPTSWLQITLTEGRNRQVRRMTAAVGLPTLRLVRVALGSLTIDGLSPGAWRDLREDELETLRRHATVNKKGRRRSGPPYPRNTRRS
ncbi:MAG TPA: pseudouridine synthase [Bryobacteraceae bacterium]|nr:pseudouridine synthase [Bryobacteraceae bacterium]